MIEGLKFDFSGKELVSHLRSKVAHHTERKAFYEQQAKALTAGGAERTDYSGGDPVKALGDKAKTHENRRSFFAVLADHTDTNETYRLSESELIMLELISRGY